MWRRYTTVVLCLQATTNKNFSYYRWNKTTTASEAVKRWAVQSPVSQITSQRINNVPSTMKRIQKTNRLYERCRKPHRWLPAPIALVRRDERLPKRRRWVVEWTSRKQQLLPANDSVQTKPCTNAVTGVRHSHSSWTTMVPKNSRWWIITALSPNFQAAATARRCCKQCC